MTRYTLTCTGQPGAKKRLRLLMSVAGMESVRIEEREQEAANTRVRPDNLPTSAEARVVADLYGRKHETPWSEKEIIAFKKAVKTGTITLENMKLIARYYASERKKPDGLHRRDLLTFLNNATGELDRARAVKPGVGKALEWASDANVVPLPAQTPEEYERIRKLGLEQIAAAKEALRK